MAVHVVYSIIKGRITNKASILLLSSLVTKAVFMCLRLIPGSTLSFNLHFLWKVRISNSDLGRRVLLNWLPWLLRINRPGHQLQPPYFLARILCCFRQQILKVKLP